MPEKQDLRVQKTYAALFQAFQELLTEKDFESITVTELCDRAMIRTATFYKHFADKYAFFAFLINEGLNRYREMLTDRSTSSVSPFVFFRKTLCSSTLSAPTT